MQKARIIRDDLGLRELNSDLSADWKVIQTCPMPSSSSGSHGNPYPTCLVVLEKIKKEKKDDIPEIGFCVKCAYAVTQMTDKGCYEFLGCRIEKDPQMGNHCPLVKSVRSIVEKKT